MDLCWTHAEISELFSALRYLELDWNMGTWQRRYTIVNMDILNGYTVLSIHVKVYSWTNSHMTRNCPVPCLRLPHGAEN